MRNIYLSQINNSYGDNAFIPYSVGLLWGYAITNNLVRDNYRLMEILFLREQIDDILDRLDNPAVVAMSCYIWNWAYNNELAIAIKKRWPNCTMIMGGPEVPNDSEGFFKEHEYVDILVHGEGERIMSEILVKLLDANPCLESIKGISFPDENLKTIKTGQPERISDLDTIPSPYLSGVFDDMMVKHPNISFNASQETHRGCPYSCTFCDWGSAVMTKVRQFDTDRILSEMRWFGENQIDLLYNCDANYGILKRDIDLTKEMIRIKEEHNGYPKKFRAAYAKKSNDKVFEIAVMLNEADMNKGVTLSMQSMDPVTLENVKRSNIKIDDFSRLISAYRTASIPTYTEVIIGLPGETFDSLMLGFDEILKAGQHDNINAYMCMLLKNSEMANYDYMARHGIKTKRVPLLSLHGTPSEMHIREMNDIVVSTDTMPYEDWKKSNVMSWMIQCLHCLGLTHVLAMDHDRVKGSFSSFYLKLHDDFIGTDTVLGKQISWIYGELDSVFERSGDWNLVDPAYGEISWPLEEYSFLQILKNIDEFYREILERIRNDENRSYISELVDFQHNLLIKPTDASDIVVRYENDILSAFEFMLMGKNASIERTRTDVMFHSGTYITDPMDYARELVWYGRKAGKTKRKVNRLT